MHRSRTLFIGPAADDPRAPAIRSAAAAAAKLVAMMDFEYLTPSDGNPVSLATLIESATARRPDALVVYVREPAGVLDSLAAAESTLANLVTIGTRPALPRLAGHVDLFEPDAAELLGKGLRRIAAGGRSYLLVARGGGDLATNVRNRFMREARGQSDMTLLAERGSPDSKTDATAVRELAQEFSNAALLVTLDAGVWSEMPSLLASFGAESPTRVATLGTAPVLWPGLRSGQFAALVGGLDGDAGRLGVEVAWEVISASQRRNTLLRIVEPELVTSRTLDEFARRYARAASTTLEELERPSAAAGAP